MCNSHDSHFCFTKRPCCWPSQQPVSLLFHPNRIPVLFGFPYPGLGLPDIFTSTVLDLSALSSHAGVQPQTDLERCNRILLRWTAALGLWEMPSWVTHREDSDVTIWILLCCICSWHLRWPQFPCFKTEDRASRQRRAQEKDDKGMALALCL